MVVTLSLSQSSFGLSEGAFVHFGFLLEQLLKIELVDDMLCLFGDGISLAPQSLLLFLRLIPSGFQIYQFLTVRCHRRILRFSLAITLLADARRLSSE